MLFSWLKKRRRQKLLARPLPWEWEDYLADNVWHYSYLMDDQQWKLRNCLKVFIAEKEWVGCGGLEMSDEVRVTVAGQACLLLLGVDGHFYFDQVKTILVYPGEFSRPAELQRSSWLVDEDQSAWGEAWQGGPVILSWEHVYEDGRYPHDGRNLVLHEFAHQIDALDGEMGGTPPLGSLQAGKRWNDIVSAEFRRLEDAVRRGFPTLLDDYGATNRAEFFAVATECFFEQPEPLMQRHGELYELLRDFYGVDPIQWVI